MALGPHVEVQWHTIKGFGLYSYVSALDFLKGNTNELPVLDKYHILNHKEPYIAAAMVPCQPAVYMAMYDRHRRTIEHMATYLLHNNRVEVQANGALFMERAVEICRLVEVCTAAELRRCQKLNFLYFTT